MFELKQFFDKANFSKQDEASIRTFLESPEATKILARAEQENVEKRRALRTHLDAIDAKYDKGIDAACKAAVEAVKAREAAEAQLAVAKAEEWRLRSAVDALESIKGKEARELRQQLTDSRDMRLDDFWMYLDSAKDKLRHLGRVTAFPLGPWTGQKSIRYETNADEVSALSTALKEAMADVEHMTLLPLSRAEVSERLTAVTHKLEPMMDAFSLPTPRLDENGAVTLSRERLKFVEVLRDNGLLERGDEPAKPLAVQATSPKSPTVKRVARQKPTAPAQKAVPPVKKAIAYTEVRMGDGSKRLYF
ncbi:hypothetical protein [Ralstonia wenshanensis]|uniref:Uncharacterized protein n=1 Tax=Ralstonia wenshanensis TaxID=2842456 RepID=A0AAD2AS24_9RALS|nr:hypothetical protein [Ralstonia wenshanensis]CAJ0688378.1 hypothetical protein LMG18091_00930 [Ralstonia wenshanensis]